MRTDIVCIGLHYPTSRHTKPGRPQRSLRYDRGRDTIQPSKRMSPLSAGVTILARRHRPRCLAGALVVVVVLPVCGLLTRHPGGDPLVPSGGGAEGGGPLQAAQPDEGADLGAGLLQSVALLFLAARSDSRLPPSPASQ